MSVSVSISIYGDSMSLYGHILMTSGSECSQYMEILTDTDITNILTSKLEGVEPTVCQVAADMQARDIDSYPYMEMCPYMDTNLSKCPYMELNTLNIWRYCPC